MKAQTLSGKTGTRLPFFVEEHIHDSYWKIIGRHQHHNSLEFFVLRSGKVTFYSGRQYHDITAGDYVLVNSNEYHSCEVYTSQARYEVIKIDLDALGKCFPLDPAAGMIRSVRLNNVLFEPRPMNDELTADIFKLLKLFKSPDEKVQLQELAVILDMISLLFQSHVSKSLTERDAQHLNSTWSKFQEVREYLENNYESRISLDEMAELAGMSRGYFCSRFKQITGKSFVDYLNLLRIEKAAADLLGTDDPVTDIALSSGFDDVNYFCRVFKRYMQISPSDYRKRSPR